VLVPSYKNPLEDAHRGDFDDRSVPAL
jgi:hypothetical protein